MDLDGTLTLGDTRDYPNVSPNQAVIETLRSYRDQGFEIAIYTSRNMRTYDRDIGKINVHTLPVILDWLDRHDVPYDEVIVGRPWCGCEGFYVDDKSVRPSEFVSLSYEEIQGLLAKEKAGPVS